MEKMRVAGTHIRSFYKLVIGSPTDDEEEDILYQFAVTLLHYCTYAFGGVYFSKDFSKSFKYKYAIFNILNFTFMTVVSSGYYTLQLLRGSIQFDLFQIFSLVILMITTVDNFIVFPIFGFVYRTEIQETCRSLSTFKANFRKINFKLQNETILNNFSCTRQGHRHKRNNIVLYPLIVYVSACIGSAMYQVSPMLSYSMFSKNERLPLVTDYNVVPPFYDRIESFSLYLCTATFFFLLTLPYIFNVVALYPFLILLCRVLEDNALDICSKMDYLSHNFVQVYEIIQKNERMASEEMMSKNQLCSAFEKDINALKNEYEKYRKCLQQFLMFISPFLNLVICSAYVLLLALTAILVAVTLSPYQFMSCTSQYIGYVIGVFIVGQMGKIFNDVTESFRYSIYNLPWYYLTPKTRKLVSLLQSAVHNEPDFRVLRVYPINMSMFPRMLSSSFSYANILRVTKQKEE